LYVRAYVARGDGKCQKQLFCCYGRKREANETKQRSCASAVTLAPNPEAEMLHHRADALEQEAEKLEEQASALASEVSNRLD
jgi:hypothetical protein